MRKHGVLATVPTAAVVLAVVVGCGGGGDGGGRGAVTEWPFDRSTAGHVAGMVMFEGTPPATETLDMASEPACAQYWGATPPTRDIVSVTAGHLENVFVHVKQGVEGMQFPVPQEEVVIDQHGCKYLPHVNAAMVNQTIVFQNSDPVLHNINATPGTNRPFNISQPVQNMRTSRTFTVPEVMIPVRCDVHGWMLAYVGVTPHPYNAVTGPDGTFELRDLPPGQHVIEIWHPRLGTQEQTVTVATGQTAQLSFTYTEAMLANAVVPLGEPIDPHDHGPGHAHHVVADLPGGAAQLQPLSAGGER